MKISTIFGLVLVIGFITMAFASLPMSAAPSEESTVRGTVVSKIVESAHNYANNYDYTWTISQTGASQMRVYFEKYQVETNYDYIYIKTSGGSTVQTLTSSTAKLAVWSSWVTGSSVKIQLKTDYSVTYYGFRITQYEYNTATADTTPPTTSITAPANGATVSQGTVSVTFTASDNVGVTGTYLSIDSGTYFSATSPYSWNTAGLTGSHTLKTKATDAAGNIGYSSLVTVTVSGGSSNVLTSGVPGSGSLSAVGAEQVWTIQVNTGCTNMYSVLTCGTADFDLYGKMGSAPTSSSYTWRGYTSGGEEVSYDNPAAGTWYIMVKSYSGTGSYQVTVTLTYGSSGPTWGSGGKYAVIVGISNYKAINDLSYCDEDATDFYNYLTAKGYECKILGDGTTANYPRHDAKATEANYKLYLNSMLDHAVTGNRVAFITSGHGSGDGSGESYLCAWDCSSGESGEDGNFYDHEISAIFNSKLKSGVNAFVFIDHCYSGGLGPEMMAITLKAQVYMTTTCSANGYGYDDPTHLNGMWTYYFLEYGLISHFGSAGTTTMESCFTYSKAAYPKTGGDIPEQYDGNTGATFTLV